MSDKSLGKPHYINYGVDDREHEEESYNALGCAFCMVILGLIAICSICKLFAATGRDERAAYCEGYYGVDRDTALAMADKGLGKTSKEVLQ